MTTLLVKWSKCSTNKGLENKIRQSHADPVRPSIAVVDRRRRWSSYTPLVPYLQKKNLLKPAIKMTPKKRRGKKNAFSFLYAPRPSQMSNWPLWHHSTARNALLLVTLKVHIEVSATGRNLETWYKSKMYIKTCNLWHSDKHHKGMAKKIQEAVPAKHIWCCCRWFNTKMNIFI